MVHLSSSCSFLFIDLQPLFTDALQNAKMSAAAGCDLQQQTQRALSLARTHLPPQNIVHIRADYLNSPMKPFSRVLNPEKPVPHDTTAVDWAAELPGEVVIVKKTINGFHETSLEEYLNSIGVKTILLCGVLTCCCVHETAIGGLVRGFQPVLVEDACADKSEEKHAATIMLYKDYLYQTCVLDEVEKEFVALKEKTDTLE